MSNLPEVFHIRHPTVDTLRNFLCEDKHRSILPIQLSESKTEICCALDLPGSKVCYKVAQVDTLSEMWAEFNEREIKYVRCLNLMK